MAPGTASRPVRTGWRKELPGFTLIEILVVVGIIAVLISVLLPSLARARELARSAACASNLSQLGRAENLYQTQNQGYIPGSPVTTGWFYARTNTQFYSTLVPNFDRFQLTWFDYATPLRAQMYGAMTAVPRPAPNPTANIGAWINLWRQATDGVFNCPSMPDVIPPWGTGANYGLVPVKAASYLTMSTIMRPGEKCVTPWPYTTKPRNIGQYSDFEVFAPASYMPRHNMLGNESTKVFLADGTRFYDPCASPASYDYDTGTTSSKGNFSASPPCLLLCGPGTVPGPEYTTGREKSYRHGGKSQLNAAFFDGHVEAMKVDFRNTARDQLFGHFTGKAIEPKYYLPRGTVVNKPETLHKTGIPVGYVVQ